MPVVTVSWCVDIGAGEVLGELSSQLFCIKLPLL